MKKELIRVGLSLLALTVSAAAQTNVTNTNNGTTNTIPVYTGTHTVGNSPISISGSNVGIGTASPSSLLTVGGTFGATDGSFYDISSNNTPLTVTSRNANDTLDLVNPDTNPTDVPYTDLNFYDAVTNSWAGIYNSPTQGGVAFYPGTPYSSNPYTFTFLDEAGNSVLDLDAIGDQVSTKFNILDDGVHGEAVFKGNVGIGMSPAWDATLDVNGSQMIETSSPTWTPASFASCATGCGAVGPGNGGIVLRNDSASSPSFSEPIMFQGPEYGSTLTFAMIRGDSNGDLVFSTMYGGNAELYDRMFFGPTGLVGIGTVVPRNALDINGSLAVGSYAGTAAGASNELVVGGKVGIGTTAPAYPLDVAGQIRSSTGGVVYPDGTAQTTAWTGVLCGGDYAEDMRAKGDKAKYGPGDVLILASGNDDDVQKSAEPYSTLVAGIYATKPGVVGRRAQVVGSAANVPMAMVGVVPTKVSAENGPIHKGDLLVSSSTPGYAMKGTDRSKMLGAVIGKAMGSLNSGDGVIEVLVTLQ